MEYHNPKLPEGINVTNEHPLKDFFYLTAAVVGAIAIIVLIVSLFAGQLVKFIPFSTEVKIATSFTSTIMQTDIDNADEADKLRSVKVTEYLQDLADKLSRAQQLPEEITITVHYINEPIVNAFATLGGHIVIYQGIIDALDNENALSMVVAHEIAHIKHRHPIVAMTRGLTVGIVLSALTDFGGNGFTNNIVSQMGLFSALAFSRSQETESDMEAYNTLVNYYGHGGGATDLFSALQKTNDILMPPELLSSHPLSKNRIEKLEALEKKTYNNCSQSGERCKLTLMPALLKPQ